MPHYSYEKSFKAGTTRAEEETLEMPCHWGILCDIDISFRFGTDRQTYVHLDDKLHQMFPTNPKGDYAFDGYTLHIKDEFELEKGTRKIYLKGWNTGSYAHTVAVAFRIKMPERLSVTEKALWRLVDIWERLTGG